MSNMIVGGTTPRVTASFTCPGNAGAYAAGNHIANSAVAASVVPMTFTVGNGTSHPVSGRVSGARCVVTPASGNLVYPALDLLLFRPTTNIPFAAGSYPADHTALDISSAAFLDLVGIFSFSSSNWRSGAGSISVAGAKGYQSTPIASGRPYAPFNLASIPGTTLLGLVQCQNAWAPGAVANTFDFMLDVDSD